MEEPGIAQSVAPRRCRPGGPFAGRGRSDPPEREIRSRTPLWRHVLREMAANLLMGLGPVRRWRVARGRTLSPEDPGGKYLIEFDVLRGVLTEAGIRDQTVLEIGPGDAAPLALFFLAAGARGYTAIDRFIGSVADPRALRLYEEILRLAPDVKEGLTRRGLAAPLFPWKEKPGLISLLPVSLEKADGRMSPVDLIVSFSSIEHLTDVRQAARSLRRLLKPGGRMFHWVDYGPHGDWIRYRNPLTFLLPSERVWTAMGSHRGICNRLRHCEVIEAFEQAGFTCRTLIQCDYDSGCVRELKELLPSRYRKLPEEELSISDAFFTAV